MLSSGTGVKSPLMSPTPEQNPDKKKSAWVQFGRYSQLAFMLPAGTVAGWLLGSLLDRWLHTSWISVVGLLLGTAAGLIELIRTVSRETK
jgi:F0F1-type ATP synthase assembly protein I